MLKKRPSLRSDIEKLLRKERLGVIATRGEPYPYATLVGFSFTKDLKHLFFATMRSTRKYRNILNNQHVSVLIDTRKNDIDDFKDALALTILGRAAELEKADKKKYLTLYLKRFPHLKCFIEDPETALVEIQVDRYIFVRRFQEVKELSLI